MPSLKSYKHIFFDLDQTLWDFETNSREVLVDLFSRYRLQELKIPDVHTFIERYHYHNHILWEQYRFNQVDKYTLREQRFLRTLQDFGEADKTLSDRLSADYLAEAPFKAALFPYCLEVLDYLSRQYKLHIITNGFEEVQYIKLRSSNMIHYFDVIVTCENSGYKKPEKHIFYHALERSRASIDNSLMIGDSMESDILGAKNIGMDQIFFNPKRHRHNEVITHEISCLSELKDLL